MATGNAARLASDSCSSASLAATIAYRFWIHALGAVGPLREHLELLALLVLDLRPRDDRRAYDREHAGHANQPLYPRVSHCPPPARA